MDISGNSPAVGICHVYHAEFGSFCNDTMMHLVQHLVVYPALSDSPPGFSLKHQRSVLSPHFRWGDWGLVKWWDICGSFFLVLRKGWQTMRVKYPLNLAELSVNRCLLMPLRDLFPPSVLNSRMNLGETTKRNLRHSSGVSSIVFVHSASRLKKKDQRS